MPVKVKGSKQSMQDMAVPKAPEKRGFFSIFSARTPAEVSVDKKLKELDSKQRSFKQFEEQLMKKKLQLNEFESKLVKLKGEIDQERLFVVEKDKQLREAIPKYNAEIDSLHKKKLSIESEIENLTKKASELRIRVLDSESVLARARSVLEKESKFSDWQKKLDILKSDIDKKAGELSRKEAELIQKEKGLKTQEYDALKKQKDLTEDLIRLSAEKKTIEQEVAVRRSELQGIKSEQSVLDAKKAELQKSTDMLHEKEKSLVEKLTKLDQDRKFVEMRRGLVNRKADELHNARLMVEEKEHNLAGRENALQQREMALGKQAKLLHTQLQSIRDVEELKENLPKLQQEKRKIVDQITKEEVGFKRQAEIVDKRARELNAMERRVIEREKTANERESRLKQREDIVAAKEKRMFDVRSELEKEKRNVQELKFQTYVEKELGKFEPHEQLLAAEIDTKSPKDFDVLMKVESARNALDKDDIESAKKYYDQISKDYEKMPHSDEKRKIYYEVLELKNDIELAMLRE